MLKVARFLALIGALGIVALGLLGSGFGLFVTFIDPNGVDLSMVTFSVSVLALTLVLGVALAWQSWQSIQRRESGPFRVRRLWPLAVVYVLAILVGQLILSWELLPPFTFPLFHALAAVVPPLIIVVLVDRGLKGGARWREVVLQLGSGAFLSTALAFALEFVFMIGLAIVLAVFLAMQPGGLETVRTLVGRLQDPTWLQDPAGMAPVTLSPLVLVVVLLVFAGFIPLFEEAVKTVGVALWAYQRPSRSRAFLWGVASGAGFAVFEGMLNTSSGLDVWAPLVLLRVGASLLHCFTGGLMGLAWYQLLMRRRWGRGLGLYAASVAVHGLWNALAAAMTLIPWMALGEEATDASQALAGLGTLVVLASLVVLALAVGLALMGLTLHLRRRAAPLPVAEEGVRSLPVQPPPEHVAREIAQAPRPAQSDGTRSTEIDQEEHNE